MKQCAILGIVSKLQFGYSSPEVTSTRQLLSGHRGTAGDRVCLSPDENEDPDRVVEVDLGLLTELHVTGPCQVCKDASGDWIHLIAQCMPNLLRLNYGSVVYDRTMLHIATSLPKLTHLNLHDCSEVTSAGYGHLSGRGRPSRTSSLQSLEMAMCLRAKDVDVQELFEAHPKLHNLNVDRKSRRNYHTNNIFMFRSRIFRGP